MSEFPYNGFKYIRNNSKDKPLVSIEHEKEIPEFLFKYYSFSKYNVSALINSYLYASHPFELNDILDSSVFLLQTSQPISYDLYEKLYYPTLSKVEIKEFYEEDLENKCTGYIFELWQLMTNVLGIISLTEREHHPLMWPHYTNEKGFQIKYRTKNLENSIKKEYPEHGSYVGLFPINYTKYLSPVDISQFKDHFIPLYYILNIKYHKWEYEDEWRLIMSRPQMGVPYSKASFSTRKDYETDIKNRYINYDSSVIEEITLGMNFINGKDFEIHNIEKSDMRIKPLNSNVDSLEETGNLIKFLNYLIDSKIQVHYSGVKYENNSQDEICLVRTKELIQLSYGEDGYYIFRRTNDVKILLDN